VVKLEDIAQQEDISASFLVQILNELKRFGLVDSKRGKAGGYLLSHPPAKVSLREVVQAAEPGLLATPDNSSGVSGPAVNDMWHGLSKIVHERLGNITLESMASEAAEPMYFI
jgi:Rrf2 family protein